MFIRSLFFCDSICYTSQNINRLFRIVAVIDYLL